MISNIKQNLFTIVISFAFIFAANTTIANHGGTGLMLPQNILFWISITPLIFYGVIKLSVSNKFSINKNLILFFVLSIALSLPIIWSSHFNTAIQLVSAIWLISLFLISLNLSKFKINHFYIIIIISSLLNCCYGLLQHFYPINTDWFQTSNNLRPLGFFQQPNVLASFVVTGTLISAYYTTLKNSITTKTLTLLLAFVAPTLIIITQSRTGYLGLIIGGLLLFFSIFKYRTTHTKHWLFVFITGTAIASLIMYHEIASSNLSRSIDSLSSPGPRKLDFTHSFMMFLEKPFFGWGYGGFTGNFTNSWVELKQQGLGVEKISPLLTHPHNEILFWLVNGGLFSTIPIIFIFSYIIYRQFRYYPKHALTISALLIPISLHLMLEYPIYHSAPHLFLMTTLFWIFISKDQSYTFQNMNLKFLRLPSITLMIATLIFFSTALQTFYIYRSLNPINVNYYKNALNPFSHTIFITNSIIIMDLQTIIDSKNFEQANETLIKAEKHAKLLPTSVIYEKMTILYYMVGDTKRAEEIFNKGKIIYRNQSSFRENISKQSLIDSQNE